MNAALFSKYAILGIGIIFSPALRSSLYPLSIFTLQQLMEFEPEEAQKLTNKDSTAELAELCLRYKQELQAEQETCSQLKYEIKLMEKQVCGLSFVQINTKEKLCYNYNVMKYCFNIWYVRALRLHISKQH